MSVSIMSTITPDRNMDKTITCSKNNRHKWFADFKSFIRIKTIREIHNKQQHSSDKKSRVTILMLGVTFLRKDMKISHPTMICTNHSTPLHNFRKASIIELSSIHSPNSIMSCILSKQSVGCDGGHKKISCLLLCSGRCMVCSIPIFFVSGRHFYANI